MRLRSPAGGSGCSLSFDANLGPGAVASGTSPKPWIPMARRPPRCECTTTGGPCHSGVTGTALLYLWAQRGGWWPAGAARAPGPQEVGAALRDSCPLERCPGSHSQEHSCQGEIRHVLCQLRGKGRLPVVSGCSQGYARPEIEAGPFQSGREVKIR